MATHGFRVWHGYASRTAKGGISSGVAILYKAHLAVEKGWDLIPHRAAGLVLQTGAMGKVLLVSAYLDVAGDEAEKGRQIAEIVHAAQTAGIEHVWVGGDFNTTPELLAANVPIAIRGQVVCTGGPTCRTRGKDNVWIESQLDDFWMSHKDRLMVTECRLEARGHTAPHNGVAVHIRLKSNQAVDVLERPRIAKQAVCGPLRQDLIQEAELIHTRATQMACKRGLDLTTSRSAAKATPEDIEGLEMLAEEWRMWATRYLREQYQLEQDEEIHSEPQIRAQGVMETISKSGSDRQQQIRLLEYMKQCCGRAVACIQGETSPYNLRRNPPYSPGRREWKDKVLQDPECGQLTKEMGKEWHELVTNYRAAQDGHGPLLTLALLQQRLEDSLPKVKTAVITRRREGWQQFVDNQLITGAGALHRITRTDGDATVPIHHQASSGGLLAEIQVEIEKWQKVWEAVPIGSGRPSSQPPDKWNKEEELADIKVPAALTGAELREAARTFRWSTSSTDGLCARHLASMPIEGLTALATILALCESMGMYASQWDAGLVRMIPKPAGGYRPIFLFRTVARVQARARAHLLRSWEDGTCRALGLYNHESGRRILDGVWRTNMRKAIGEHAAGMNSGKAGEWAVLCRDLAKAFDTVPRQELWEVSKLFGYPRWLLRLSLNHYAGTRYMLFDHGLVGPAWNVGKGICPGSTAATRELKLVLMAGLIKLRQQVPQASISVHVDDYRIEIAGQDNDAVLETAASINALLSAEWDRLGIKQAGDKQELYATNRGLEERLGRLVKVGTNKQGVAAMLGVDLAYRVSMRRSVHRKVKLKGRMAKHRIRSQLVAAKLAGCRQARRAAKRIYATGVLRGLIYGAEVTKYTSGQLQAAQRQARTAIGLRAGGVPAYILDLLHPKEADPMYHMTTAPVLQMAREWWCLGLRDNRAAPDELSGKELWQLQQILVAHQTFGHQRHGYGRLDNDPLLGPLADSCGRHKVWWLKHPGQAMVGPTRVDFRYVSPGDIERLLATHHLTSKERTAAGELGWPAGTLVNSDLLRQASNHISIKQVALLAAGLMGTPALAAERAGQEVPVCPNCHKNDDQQHRLRPCQDDNRATIVRTRKRYKGPQSADERRERWRAANPMGHRLLVPRRTGPLHLHRGEREDDGIHLEWHGEGDDPGPAWIRSTGEDVLVVYTDGSGKYPTGGRAGIAGSGMVFALPAGHMHCSDAVPEALPQTASIAESWAAIQAIRLAQAGSRLRLVTDCAMVVTRVQNGWRTLRKGGRGAGLWKQFMQISEDKHMSVQVQKTKAHRTQAQAAAEDDLVNFRGNEAADKAAARGSQVYHGPSEAVEEELRLHKRTRQWPGGRPKGRPPSGLRPPSGTELGNQGGRRSLSTGSRGANGSPSRGLRNPEGLRTCTAAKYAVAGAGFRRTKEGSSEPAPGGSKGQLVRP
jgi:hypothetical protein